MKKKFQGTAEIWAEVELRLKYELEPSIKKALDEQGYVRDVEFAENQTEAFFDLFRLAKLWRKMVNGAIVDRKRQARPANGTKVEAPSSKYRNFEVPNAYVIQTGREERDLWSLFLARKTDGDEALGNFRGQFLKEGMLKSSEVQDWVASVTPEGLVIDEVMDALDLKLGRKPGDACEPRKADDAYGRFMNSMFVSDSLNERLSVVGGLASPLGQLVIRAAQLSMSKGWLFSETVWFILTGATPQLPAIRAFPIKEFADSGPTILLEVDPEVSPEEVRQAYKELRDKLKVRTHNRPPNARILGFIKFVLGKDDVDPSQPVHWASLVDEWNQLDFVKEKDLVFTPTARRRAFTAYTRAIKRIEPSISKELWSEIMPPWPKESESESEGESESDDESYDRSDWSDGEERPF